MAKVILEKRFEDSKICSYHTYMKKLEKFLIGGASLWILVIGLQDGLTMANSIYSLCILLATISINLAIGEKKLSYFTYTALAVVLDISCLDLGFWKYPQYSCLFIASSTQFLYHGFLGLAYCEMHGYICILLNFVVWTIAAVYSGCIPMDAPPCIIYILFLILILRLFSFKYSFQIEKTHFCDRIRMENKDNNIQGLLAVIADGILVLDYDLNVQMKNTAFDALIGNGEYRNLEYLEHHRNESYKKNTQLSQDIEYFISSCETSVTFGVTKLPANKIECAASKLYWDDKQAIVVTFRNVTALIDIEREITHKSETLDLIRGVSHELKNSINIIINKHIQVLNEDKDLIEDTRNCINTSLSSCRLLLCSLRDIIDFSNIKRNNFSLVVAPVNIRQALEECVRLVQSVLNYEHLSVDIDNRIPRFIETDKSRVQQVVISALSSCIA